MANIRLSVNLNLQHDDEANDEVLPILQFIKDTIEAHDGMIQLSELPHRYRIFVMRLFADLCEADIDIEPEEGDPL